MYPNKNLLNRKPDIYFKMVGIEAGTPDLDSSIEFIQYVSPFDNRQELDELLSLERLKVLEDPTAFQTFKNLRNYSALCKVAGAINYLKDHENFLMISDCESALLGFKAMTTIEPTKLPLFGRRFSTAKLKKSGQINYKKALSIPNSITRLNAKSFTNIIFLDPCENTVEVGELLIKVNNLFSRNPATIDFLFLKHDEIDFKLQENFRNEVQKELAKYE